MTVPRVRMTARRVAAVGWSCATRFMSSGRLTVAAVVLLHGFPQTRVMWEAVARDLAAVGIRVNTIAPGLIDTPIYGEGEASEAFKAKLGESVLFPKYFTDRDEPAQLGWVLMALSIGGLVGALGYAVLAGRARRRTVMLTAVLVLGVAMTVIAFLPPLPVILLLSAVVGLVYGPIAPIYNYVMQTTAPQHLRGRVVGVEAQDVAEQLGEARIKHMFSALGFDRAPDIELIEKGRPLWPTWWAAPRS